MPAAEVAELLGLTDGNQRVLLHRARARIRAQLDAEDGAADEDRAFSRRRRAIVCREAVALMAGYLDGALSGATAARLEAHLADCPHCSEYLAQIRVTIDTLGRVEPDDLPDEALDDLVALYRRWQAD